MTTDTPGDIRKRILFLSFVLGCMAGISLYLIFKAVQQQNYLLIVVLLPMFITSIPLAKTLARLRKARQAGKAGAAPQELPD